MRRIVIGITVGALLWGSAAFGETVIHRRKQNQQDRIANGVQNGSLTAGETARLERRETHLNREIRRDRAANGGSLTSPEKARIAHQQNRLSREIRIDKHNGRQR